ncbi:hypothetical protein ABKV19_010167 [Rosa sericea]
MVLEPQGTLVSAGEKFELGFFTPTPTGKSNSGADSRYVGIWYHKVTPRTVVWVANRDEPLPANSFGVLTIEEGNLRVLDTVTGKHYWSTDIGTSSSSNMIVKIMESGNLVLMDSDQMAANILWQSFQNATDTFIPGMLMDTHLELTSWSDEDDPRTGNFTFKLDQQSQFIILKNSMPYWKTGGPGKFFSSVEMPRVIAYLLSNFSNSTFTNKGTGKFNKSAVTSPPLFDYSHARLVVTPSGELKISTWIEDLLQWVLFWSEPKDQCSVYNACGNFGSCNINNKPVVCKCLPGFKPQYLDKWTSGDFSDGCTRDSSICGHDDTFLRLKMMKVGNPDTEIVVNDEIECKNKCLNICQCQAYSYAAPESTARRDLPKTSLCRFWLMDLNNLVEEYDNSHDIAARVALSDIESTVRDCEPCGTTIIPYPLSTSPYCGDPMYMSFSCDGYTGQLSFMGTNETFFRVINISQSTQRFVIQGLESKNVDGCDSKNKVNIQMLNTSFPFKVINWCSADLGNFNSESSRSFNVLEMGWELPLEPTCGNSETCRDWPHSTCNPGRDGRKRCLCNTNFQWSAFNMNCAREDPQERLKQNKHSRIKMSLVIVGVLITMIFMACIISLYVWRRNTKRRGRRNTKRRDQMNHQQLDSERRVKELIDTSHFKEEDEKSIDVPFFDLQSIQDATDNFSFRNKLGQGGYGPVYKGKFPGGQEIAVKRLSRVSGQGLQEFKNEVVLIAKLQHRNLVRLRGYCMEGEEKILLYEYMPNKSLDSFIFDHTQNIFINWEMRFNIILGIARGLLYLHQDSRLRIIHRDLKTSNILLDEEMNPKISDFGLARIVGGKETEANTNTVVGTYGYMSPEYALDGTFSVKSDVFSFGVVLLEITSGKKNTGFYQSKQTFSLLGYAWGLWTENKVLDLLDIDLQESCNKNQFFKCVNIGLLCVQEDPSDRPTMSNVVAMLDSETAILPVPKHPAFLIRRENSSTASSSTKPETQNEMRDASNLPLQPSPFYLSHSFLATCIPLSLKIR